MDVAQTVVAGVAAAKLELGLPGHDVQLVMRHQDFLGRNLEKPGQGGHRFAGQIHEGQRLQQPDGLPVHRGAGHLAVVAFVQTERHLQLARERFNPPEAGVVARGFVFGAGVAQANKQFDHVVQ